MTKNGQDPQPLAQGSDSGPATNSHSPDPVQQSQAGAKVTSADPQAKVDVGAGANPSSANDPAKCAQTALNNTCVASCTSSVEAYRNGSINKRLAIHQITVAVLRTGRFDLKHTAPWLKQLDEHDAADVVPVPVRKVGQNAPDAGIQSANSSFGIPSNGKRKRADAESDSDSDDDMRHNTRRNYNPDAAGFRKALFTLAPVSPHVQKTLDTRDNYTADLKLAKRDVIRGGHCPSFPAQLLDAILCDNAIDFDKIYSARFSCTVDDNTELRIADGVFIHVPAHRVKKRIVDQSDWQLCFNSWFDIVCFLYPHRRTELLSYLEYVMDLFASLHKSFHDRVILADVHMRNTIQGDSRASFFDRDRLQSCALRYVSPWGAEAGAQSQSDDASCSGEEVLSDDSDDEFPPVEDATQEQYLE